MAGGPELPWVLGALAPLLDSYGYAVIAALVTLEDFGIPVPGETVLIAGAVYARAGRLNIDVVVLIAMVAAVVAENIGCGIGRFGGRALLARYGRYVLITERRLNTAGRLVDRHGGAIVTVARFEEGLRQLNGLIAGSTSMPWRRFLAFNALGAGLWAGAWAGLGYLAGSHITPYQQIRRYQLLLLVMLGVLGAVLIVWHLLRRHSGETSKR